MLAHPDLLGWEDEQIKLPASYVIAALAVKINKAHSSSSSKSVSTSSAAATATTASGGKKTQKTEKIEKGNAASKSFAEPAPVSEEFKKLPKKKPEEGTADGGTVFRIDAADQRAYPLSSFVDVYGGSPSSPPEEWMGATTATAPGWNCACCTLLNSPTSVQCDACSELKPLAPVAAPCATNATTSSAAASSTTSSSPPFPPSTATPSVTEEKMLVPAATIGKVIGTHGSVVKQLQDLTGAHIDIARTTTTSGHREVAMQGTPAAIADCRHYIVNVVLNDEQLPKVTRANNRYVSTQAVRNATAGRGGASKLLNPLPSLRTSASASMPMSSVVAGFLFPCSSKTVAECLSSSLFGLGRKYWPDLQSIKVGKTPIYLFNMDTWELHGEFVATSAPGINIDPAAWKSQKKLPGAGSPFPAQVHVKQVIRLGPAKTRHTHKELLRIGIMSEASIKEAEHTLGSPSIVKAAVAAALAKKKKTQQQQKACTTAAAADGSNDQNVGDCNAGTITDDGGGDGGGGWNVVGKSSKTQPSIANKASAAAALPAPTLAPTLPPAAPPSPAAVPAAVPSPPTKRAASSCVPIGSGRPSLAPVIADGIARSPVEAASAPALAAVASAAPVPALALDMGIVMGMGMGMGMDISTTSGFGFKMPTSPVTATPLQMPFETAFTDCTFAATELPAVAPMSTPPALERPATTKATSILQGLGQWSDIQMPAEIKSWLFGVSKKQLVDSKAVAKAERDAAVLYMDAAYAAEAAVATRKSELARQVRAAFAAEEAEERRRHTEAMARLQTKISLALADFELCDPVLNTYKQTAVIERSKSDEANGRATTLSEENRALAYELRKLKTEMATAAATAAPVEPPAPPLSFSAAAAKHADSSSSSGGGGSSSDASDSGVAEDEHYTTSVAASAHTAATTAAAADAAKNSNAVSGNGRGGVDYNDADGWFTVPAKPSITPRKMFVVDDSADETSSSDDHSSPALLKPVTHTFHKYGKQPSSCRSTYKLAGNNTTALKLQPFVKKTKAKSKRTKKAGGNSVVPEKASEKSVKAFLGENGYTMVRRRKHFVYEREYKGAKQKISIPTSTNDVRTWKNVLAHLRDNNRDNEGAFRRARSGVAVDAV